MSTTEQVPSVRDRIAEIFEVPRPVKKLFDAVPLVTYPPNELPERSPEKTELCSLYVFCTAEDAERGRPSYNPGCLKWQTALRMSRLPHILVPSSNHASPTGSLPFLLPPTSSPLLPATLLPIPSSKLLSHASKQGHSLASTPQSSTQATPTSTPHITPHPKASAYFTLIDSAIRPAWLHSLYLADGNQAIAHQLYISSTTSNWIVQQSIKYSLKRAAEDQLLLSSTTGRIDVDDIYARAASALAAFSALLEDEDEDGWLLGGDEKGGPTLLDAALFAYTHLLLDEGMKWVDKRLAREVKKWKALVKHRQRILREFYGSER